MIGDVIGWVGVGLGLVVPIPQLLKIIEGKNCNGVSLHTYAFLVAALACYLAHAIHIGSEVFTVAQSINLATNGIILYKLRKQ